MTTQSMQVDIAVIGAGSAGVSAAIGAAQSGARVMLVEKHPFPGGKATAAMVGTVCGLYLNHPGDEVRWAMGGYARQFGEMLAAESDSRPEKFSGKLHVLPYNIEAFKTVCNQLLDEHGVECLWKFGLKEVQHSHGKVDSVLLSDGAQNIILSAKAYIDCTGEALVSQRADMDWVVGGENQAAARVFQMDGIASMPSEAIHFALSVALRRGVSRGLLAEELATLNVVPGSFRNGRAYFKLPLPETVSNEGEQRAAMKKLSEERIGQVVHFLKENVASFEKAVLVKIAPEVGFRTGYRSVGKEELQAEDVLHGRKHPDGIANGSWPIEFWKPGEPVHMEFFEDAAYYQIPAGCLESKNAKNLYFAGRNLSATPRAIASARVMGTCLQTGFAGGVLAAAAAQQKDGAAAIAQIRQQLEIE